MDPYINLDFYRVFMEQMTTLIIQSAAILAEANGEAIGIQGNIANAGMMGSEFFEKYVLPYEKKLVRAVYDAGCFSIYHNCGKAEVLQQSYVEMGVTAWETVAESPQGNNDLGRAKANVGGQLTLIGNLDQVKCSQERIFYHVFDSESFHRRIRIYPRSKN